MKRLGSVWQRDRRYASLRSGCVIVLAAIALLTMVFVLDWQLDLEGAARLSLLGISALTIVSIAYLIWWRKRRPYDPVTCALKVERVHPEFGGLLVSYVQFRNKGLADGDVSLSLVNAMLNQAEEKGRTISFQGMVRFGAMWKLYLAVILTGMVVAAAMINQPRFAQAFIARIFDPFSENRYPTRTILEETSGELVIQQGQSVLLRAVVSGEVPEAIAIRVIPQGGAEDVLRVGDGISTKQGNRVFEYQLDDVQRDFKYKIFAGDAASRTYQVRAVRGPLQQIEAIVTYPAYLEREPTTTPLPSFDAPMGSMIQWKLSVDRPMANGRMVLDDDKSVPVILSDGNRTGAVAATPKDSFTYGLEWTDDESGFVFVPSVRYPVRIVPDLAPKIFMKPGPTEEKASVWNVVDLDFTATDDHGLASARLVYTLSRSGRSTLNAKEMTKEIRVFPKTTLNTAETLKWRIKDSIPDLAAGDVVSYAVEVLDRQPAPGGPGVGRSETRIITVVTQEEYVTIANEKQRRLLAQIKNLLQEEVNADKQIQSLIEETAEGSPEK